jgi:hypothetical protein
MLNSQLRKGVIPMDIIHLIVTALVSLFFAGVFILVPLFKSDIRHVEPQVKYFSMLYFSCLGMGFILFELVFIQVFMKLIGYPVYTYILVIFTLLFGAGLGSASSRWLRIDPGARWSWPFAGVLVYGGLFVLVYPAVFDHFLASQNAVRMIVAASLILPLGFLMGIPFPLGILVVERHSSAAVAWAWGLNGLFTVIGSLASVLLGIAVGFQGTILIAVGAYAVAFLAFARLRVAHLEVAAIDQPPCVDLSYADEVRA